MKRAEALQLIGGLRVFEETAGASELKIGIIDGPVATGHPDFRGTRFQTLADEASPACKIDTSFSCQHGTFIAGMLGANRDSEAPALCPQCTFVLRPIFCEERGSGGACPVVTPKDLAVALVEVMETGAKIINLSLGLIDDELHNHPELKQVYDEAAQQGIILVGASGNQKRIGALPLFEHPWVIPVAACNSQGRILKESNTGTFAALRGLLAPGENIASTSSKGGLISMTGTSMAAPWVTGALALLWSLYPEVAALEVVTAILRPSTSRKQITPPLLNLEESRNYLHQVVSRKRALRRGSTMKYTSSSGIVPAGATVPVPTLSSSTVQSQGCLSCEESHEYASETTHPSYVYAIGQLKAKFPSEGVRREFNRVAHLAKYKVPDDRLIYEVLKDGRFLYLAWEMDWVLENHDVGIYLVKPRSDIELTEMVEALKPSGGQSTYSVVIGVQVPNGGPGKLNVIHLPWVICNQFYHFTFAEFTQNIVQQAGVTQAIAENMFQSMMKKTDNTGATDASRAINYLVMRYMAIYTGMATMVQENYSFVAVHVEPVMVMGNRQLVDVIFEYETKDVGRRLWQGCRVDVTGLFPFLVAELSPRIPSV